MRSAVGSRHRGTARCTVRTSEALEQRTVCEYLDLRRHLYCHVTNGGSRDVREAANLKKIGGRAGVPDLLVFEPRGSYHGLAIEMKRDARSAVSKEQRRWANDLNERGYLAVVCAGAREAIAAIDAYMRSEGGISDEATDSRKCAKEKPRTHGANPKNKQKSMKEVYHEGMAL